MSASPVAHLRTVAFSGIDVLDVDVQVALGSGLPAFTIVGLPDKAVGESRERVRAALAAIGLSLPAKRITVNLAPADIVKEGSHFDLPIALGLLIAMDLLPAEDMAGFAALGELGLDGSLMPVSGVLPAAIAANGADLGLICPGPQGPEAAMSGNEAIYAPGSLLEVINHFKGSQVMATAKPSMPDADRSPVPDMADVRGQPTARRALEVAAAGGHNLLMSGPPGAGKSMLAARLPGLLPPLSTAEALEISMIHSVAGTLPEDGLVRTRPFRDPHHSASVPAIVGGGAKARPGEISLAHRGVLFLDELPEFARPALEALRQPLETNKVVIARANAHVSYPAGFQLIAAMNPCRCGHLGDPAMECSRAPKCGLDYQAKLSGPLLDRFDLFVDVPMVTHRDLSAPGQNDEASAPIAARVAKAREVQHTRFAGSGLSASATSNADLSGTDLENLAPLTDDARSLLNDAAEKMRLSARGYHRVLRVARTIADLEGAEILSRTHIGEAVSFRRVTLN